MKFFNKIVYALFLMLIIGNQSILTLENSKKFYKLAKIQKGHKSFRKAKSHHKREEEFKIEYDAEDKVEHNDKAGKQKIIDRVMDKIKQFGKNVSQNKLSFLKGFITAPLGMMVQCLDTLILEFLDTRNDPKNEVVDEKANFDLTDSDFESFSFVNIVGDLLSTFNSAMSTPAHFNGVKGSIVEKECIFLQLKDEIKFENQKFILDTVDEIEYVEKLTANCKNLKLKKYSDVEKDVNEAKRKIRKSVATGYTIDHYRKLINKLEEMEKNINNVDALKKDIADYKTDTESIENADKIAEFAKDLEKDYKGYLLKSNKIISGITEKLSKNKNKDIPKILTNEIKAMNNHIKNAKDQIETRKKTILQLLKKSKYNKEKFLKAIEEIKTEMDNIIVSRTLNRQNQYIFSDKNKLDKEVNEQKKQKSSTRLKIEAFFKNIFNKIKLFFKHVWNGLVGYVKCKLEYKKYEIIFDIGSSVLFALFPGFALLKIVYRLIFGLWNWLDVYRQWRDARGEKDVAKRYEAYGTVCGLSLGIALYIIFGFDLLPPERSKKALKAAKKMKRFRLL